jgi:hypothetical protein
MRKLLALPTTLAFGLAISACDTPTTPAAPVTTDVGSSVVEMPPPDDHGKQPGTDRTPTEVNNQLWVDEPAHAEGWDPTQ